MGALDGVRVIDFGQWIAGPLAAMLLADQGAEVIHVDPPGGPRWKTPANATFNRGKTSLDLDLRDDPGRSVARRLTDTADVVIENFRPGVMDRLGLGALETTGGNPRLIYCSLPGFASDDPRASMPAWEGALGAATGVYLQAGEARFTALPISSTFGAIAAAVSIVMALIARQRDGLGQQIEVPLFDATFLAIGSTGLLVNGKREGGRPDDPWAGIFPCADGRWVRLSLATFRFLQRFVEAVEKADWIAKGYVQRDRPGPLARGTALRERQHAELSALFRNRTAAEWEELGRRADVPLTLIRTTAEWLSTDHATSAGIVANVIDPELGAMIQPGLAVRLMGTPGAVRARPGHAADRTATGRAMTWTSAGGRGAPPPPPATTRLRAALEGIRVVDLTQVLAGPTATRTLAEFGADVVKVNNPREEGAGYRWQVHRYHTDVNRGKRTILVDLKTHAGLDVLWRLIERADVVMQNFRLGAADRLGIGYEQVKARRPDIVYGSVSFCGYGGPWERVPGYEPNAQAATGMAARMGGSAGPPGPQPFAPNDYATGLLGAFAVGLALFHRQRSGEGQHVETSLVAAATVLQAASIQTHDGPVPDALSGPDALGWSPLQRLYRASDGWFFLGAQESQRRRLAAPDGVDGIAVLNDRELEVALENCFAKRPVAEWVSALTAAGIGAQPLASAIGLMRDPWVVAHGLSVTRTHEGGDAITTIGPPFRLSRTPVVPGAPVGPPGADAATVLASLGMADRLDELVAKRAIALE
jgi:crotonobetainyl-CoA:carnitine CoA-transferase CaiB-like acyl-CoA transferase